MYNCKLKLFSLNLSMYYLDSNSELSLNISKYIGLSISSIKCFYYLKGEIKIIFD